MFDSAVRIAVKPYCKLEIVQHKATIRKTAKYRAEVWRQQCR